MACRSKFWTIVFFIFYLVLFILVLYHMNMIAMIMMAFGMLMDALVSMICAFRKK
ncbi:hypothetical protein [Acetilactobacillus jinshanensis]|uniref:hypothetical protein n=1 Tax=Acetilactobacillus jinshanensis TaxID=1720083 RepID=UPI001583E23F|nr:hypothetical protein [Acetilactobacillus jinshanensis]URL60622.1 hypothetical protein HGK75_00935 [uncultured bacterium]